mgnify:CR=1 FL=1
MYSTGEWVSVKALGFIDHFGVATGDGRVVSNSLRHGGVLAQSEPEFSAGKPVTRHGSPDPSQAHSAAGRALSRIGEPWRPLSSNCEHFVRKVYGLREESPQAMGVMIFGALALGVLFFARSGR